MKKCVKRTLRAINYTSSTPTRQIMCAIQILLMLCLAALMSGCELFGQPKAEYGDPAGNPLPVSQQGAGPGSGTSANSQSGVEPGWGGFLNPSGPGQITPPAPQTAAAPGQIIVKVSDRISDAELTALIPGTLVRVLASPGDTRYLLYLLDDPAQVPWVLLTLWGSGKVLAAEENYYYTADLVPTEPFYSGYQYAPRVTDCEAAWELEQGSPTVTVAVLDSGINGTHEELAGRVLAGWDIMLDKEIPAGTNSDILGHGTHVAGIIAASGDNGRGIAGVAWHVQLLPVKIFAEDRYTTSAEIAAGMFWAIDHGADIVNMSLGGGLFSMAVNDAVNYAYQQGVVLVASIGNDFTAKISYPAALPGVIAVGSSNSRNEVSCYSSTGEHISVVAPGEGIYSLKNTGDTEYMFASGTSMAGPFVSGLAALLLSRRPELTPGQVRSIIEDSAQPLGPEDFSPAYGHGLVNVYQALTIPPRDNYSAVIVNVSNRGALLGGVKVLLENTRTSAIVRSGLTSYGGLPGGVNGQIVFQHIPAGSYKVRAHVGRQMEADIDLILGGEDASATFTFDTPVILVVNGIKNTDIALLTDEYFYARRLSGMDKYYTFWKTAYYGPPTLDLLTSYDGVIWFTGRTRDDEEKNIAVLTGEEQAVLQAYLDSGGNLFLCGNNIAESLAIKDPAFLKNYLHVDYLAPTLDYEELRGSSFLSDMELILYMEDDDEIAPGPGGVGILDASDDLAVNQWAACAWANDYRLVFSSVCPNEILYSDPDAFLEKIVSWLESAEPAGGTEG